ncbi:hypothetical protein E5676_scaffold87G00720 [Cucumis melo var. makuwa]|uniref:Uncharacterized protein n=1 Tax=Cucumis melo var. makuwa TaxID=1194695 RepID=A0A5D3CCF3_CUCMM|nr:hypothetical protein E5676_scaffold87G00720 [Cucumis melo var. makuwa]
MLSVGSIGGHNQVSSKGFPTTGPRIEAGNVVIHRGLHVTRPLVVACVPSGVRSCLRIDPDAGCSSFVWTLIMEFGRARTCTLRVCASFGSTRLICASFGSTRLIGASLGITRLIGVSFGITRLVRVQRGADRREAGRMREGHMDASGFLDASADVFLLSSDLSLVRKVGSLQGWLWKLVRHTSSVILSRVKGASNCEVEDDDCEGTERVKGSPKYCP